MADSSHHYFSVVCACVMIGFCVFGLLGNSISSFVYLQPKFRPQAVHAILAGISLTNLALLVVSGPVFALQCITYDFDQTLQLYANSFTRHLLMYAMPACSMLLLASAWLLVLLALERFLVICHPMLSVCYGTRRHSTLAILGILLFSALVNLVRFWEFRWVAGEMQQHLRNDTVYMTWYWGAWDLLIQYSLPAIMLVFFCSIILANLVRLKRRGGETSLQELVDQRLGQMLLAMVTVFLICFLMRFIVRVAETRDPTLLARSEGHFLSDLSHALLLINAAGTCLIYLAFYEKYRKEVRQMFQRCCFLRTYRENQFATSVQNLDRRVGGSVRLNELSTAQQRLIRRSMYGRRTMSEPGKRAASIPAETTRLSQIIIEEP